MELIACTCDLWGLVPPGEQVTHHHLDPVLGWRDTPDGREYRLRWPEEGWVEPSIWVDWKAVARALTIAKYDHPDLNWKGERQTTIKVGRRA